jgi:hypothetical protein
MNLKTNISLLVALGLTSAAIAGDEISTRVTIAMVDDESAEELRLELDSDQLGFDLHDMQEGESRSIVDQSGRNILITRKAEGFTFDVDGKFIKMPLLEGGQWRTGRHRCPRAAQRARSDRFQPGWRHDR